MSSLLFYTDANEAIVVTELSRETLRLPQRSAGFSSGIFDPKRRQKSWILAMQACCCGIAIRKSQARLQKAWRHCEAVKIEKFWNTSIIVMER